MLDPISIGLGVGGIASNLLTNSQNQANFDKQFAYSKWQYEDMKKYNSMQEQVARMRAAGMNPAFMNGALTPGNASSNTQPGAPSLTPLDLSGLSSLGTGIVTNNPNVKNIESQTQKNEVETLGMETDNVYKAAKHEAEINESNASAYAKRQMARVSGLEAEFAEKSMQYRISESRYKMELLESQVVAQDLINHYLPSKLPAEVNQLISQQFANYATGRASLQMAHQNLMEIYSKYGGTPDERKEYFKATLSNLVQQKNESKSREWQNANSVNPVPYNQPKRQEYFDWRNSGKYQKAHPYFSER